MKIAVIGTGNMGRNHVRVLKGMSSVKEIVLSDIFPEILKSVANEYAIDNVYTDYKKLIDKENPDGVIVATPPDTHKEISIYALQKKIAVLVEKPIAHKLDDARAMIFVAKKNKSIFTIGHVERFNPVVTKIKEFIDKKLLNNIYLINTHRIGPFPKRLLGKFEGVLVDLAVHDFDIINYLGGPIKSINSETIMAGKQEIYAMTMMKLKNGIKASSEFSWISPRYMRTIEIYGDSGMIMGDYFNQEVWFYENSEFDYASPLTNSFLGSGLITPGKIIKYPLYKEEPLLLELKNFINAIQQKSSVLVKPKDAYLALEAVLKIV